MITLRLTRLAIAFALLVTVLPSVCRADQQFMVTLDTTNLAGGTHAYGAGAPYSLDFTLTSGNIPTQSNTVTISDISLGGGSSTPGTGTATGSASGDLSSAISLSSGVNMLNDFFQSFVPGTTVSFLVDLSTNYAGGTPDNFSFSILDTNLNPILTTDPSLANTLMNVDIVPGLTASSFNVSAGLDQNGSPTLGPPGVSAAATVPEPSTFLLTLTGALTFASASVWKRRAKPGNDSTV